MYQIDSLKEMNKLEKIAITKHAKERLEERGIKVDDITHCIDTGEIIRQYEDDKPLPSCLILGETEDNKYIHMVLGRDDDFIYLITAYYPDPAQWESDLKTRKER